MSSLGDEALEGMAQFARCRDLGEVNAVFLSAVQSEVSSMQDLIAEADDAFDVVELMRLREIPPVPVTANRIGIDGSGAAIELVSLLLIARGSRKPGPTPRSETRPHEATEGLHQHAAKLLRLSTYKLLTESTMRRGEPLARLAADYQSHNGSVRSMQYATLHYALKRQLFDNQVMDRVMRETVGFTYEEFNITRQAIQKFYSQKLTEARDILGDVAAESRGGKLPQTEERIAQGRRAAIDLLFLPGERASFRVEDIVARTTLDSSQVFSVLSTFSCTFDNSRRADDLVADFLRGANPFARRALLTDDEGNHVMTSLQIGTDCLRRIPRTP